MKPLDVTHFESRLTKGDGDECWPWNGTTYGPGYGHYRYTQAHRASYQLYVGPIPDGLTIDHLCRNPNCVNPAHLEAVTSRENTLRGEGPAAQNARKTHCIHGHPLSGDNLCITKRGFRACRTCGRAFSRRARQRQRAMQSPREVKPLSHGWNGYIRRHCRCDVCRAANAQHQRDLRARKRASA